MAKARIYQDKQSLEKVISGIKKNAEVVAKTYGYTGREICIRYNDMNFITNDGVTVSNNIFFEDELEDLGSSFIRNITRNSDLSSSDGTTASAILSKSMIDYLSKYLFNKKTINNWLNVKDGMFDAYNAVVNIVEANKKKIKFNKKNIYSIAYTSTRDKELSEVLAQVFVKIGKQGKVLYKEAEGKSLDVEYKSGFNIDYGYSTTMLPNIFTNPKVMIFDERLNSVEIIKLVLNVAIEKQITDIVFFVKEGMADLVMQQLVKIVQSPNINLNIGVVNITGSKEATERIIEDLSIITNATILNNGTISNFKSDNLGEARNINIGLKQTTIVDGKIDTEKFAKHLKELETKYKNNRSDGDKTQLEKRIANLKGQVAIINVGGFSRERIENYKDKIKDAVGSINNALENGVVIGGGVALLDVYRLTKLNSEFNEEIVNKGKEYQIGYNAVIQSLKSPFEQILENSYATDIINRKNSYEVYSMQGFNMGFNAITRQLSENLFKEGIIDPYNTVINSLRNALDICSLFANLDGFIIVNSEVLE